jgi:Spy/CpxP family protein refolding chaperone
MKHAMLTLGFVAALATGLQAQSQEAMPSPASQQQATKQLSPSERAKKDAERAGKQLSLSEDQKAKWEAASLERINANTPIKQKLESCTTPEERKTYRSQLRANQEKYHTTVTALLTPEQKAKYDQMKKERHDHNWKMKEGHRPAGQ